MINEVRNTVMYILSKDNNGYITPEEFNSYAKQAQIDELEQIVYDYNYAMYKHNNRQIGTGYGDIAKQAKETMDRLTEYDEVLTASGGQFLLPTVANGYTDNYFRILNINYNYTTNIEREEPYRIMNQLNSMLMTPDESFPVYTHEGNAINVYPTTITANVLCTYVRYPHDPKWTYYVVGGDPVFNQAASDYQDFELPLVCMPRLIQRIAEYCGVQIREAEVVQYMNSEEITDKQLKQ